MLKSYQRRAFLLCALMAAEPATLCAAYAGQTSGAGLTSPVINGNKSTVAFQPVAAGDTGVKPGVAVAAIPGGAAPPAEPETLWDVLSRIDRNANAVAAGPTRLPLGTVPGFTLPASPNAKLDLLLVGKKKPRSGPFAALGNWFDSVEAATHSTIKTQGSATLDLRSDSVSGGSEAQTAFQSDNYLGSGGNGIYTNANMHVDATLFDSFHYSADINNSAYSQPDSNKFKVDYKTKANEVQFGDINASFSGNSLIDFSRYVSGIEATDHWSPFLTTTTLISETKGTPTTRVIPGNNSAGPYFVFSGQIVAGSVSVRVDNVDKTQGKDYTLDPISGELTFLNGYIVLSSSTIAVTYETLNSGQAGSGVYGLRTDVSPASKSGMHFGVTYLMQQSSGNSAPTQQTQEFQGFPTANSAYPLNYPIDTTKPYTVTAGGNLMQANVDYYISPLSLNQITFTHGVSASLNVIITYFPLNTDPTPGNRSVLGLDGTVPVGRIGSMTLETALSGLSITGKSVDGEAWKAHLTLTPAHGLHADIVLKDISPSFSSIQSPGFNQNEKSLQISSDYSPIQALHFTASWEKAKRPSYSTTGTTSDFTVNTLGNDTYNQYTVGVSYKFVKNGTISLNRNSSSTQYIVGGNTASINDTLSVNYTLGKVGLEAGLTRNNSATNSIYDLTGTTLVTAGATTQDSSIATDTFSKHVGLTWNPLKWIHLTGSFSDNAINNLGTAATGLPANQDARDTQLSSTFDVSRGLKVQYSLSLSDTGDLNNTVAAGTTGTTTGTTTGSTTSTGVTGTGTTTSRSFLSFFAPWTLPTLPWMLSTRDTTTSTTSTTPLSSTSAFGSTTTLVGGGVNSSLGSTGNYGGLLGNGIATDYTGASLGGRSLTNHISVSYSPTQRVHAVMSIDQSSSVGSYLYNSNRSGATLGVDYMLSKRMHFNVNYNMQNLAYTGGLGGTKANTLSCDFEGHPFGGKLNMRLGWQSLRNNSNINTAELAAAAGTGTITTPATTTGTTSSTGLTNTSTNLASYLFHVDYPIGNRLSVFLDLSDSITTGYEGSTQDNTRFGLDYALTQALKFSFGWQLLSSTNQDTSLASSNYKTSSLLAEFGLRF